MLCKSFFAVIALVAASNAATVPEGNRVLTAQRVYHTVVDTSPFLVDRTTVVVWTQSPSITATSSVVIQTPA
ncbi:hypothetical protein FPV67DRAFT_1664888 [Lyophyllum atratum]|nr:hypothetical protein FPV67DRAFT_1664888 [Lyophyllum atratum]